MELSNAVTVLIARMESHPDDFGPGNKFAGVADALYGMLGLVQDIPRSAYWFLTDADKEALTEAWKKYHRTRMEKEVMEKIFDDGAEEREREMERIKMRQQMYQQQIYQQQAHMPQPVSALNSAQGSGNYYNGGGLLGQAGSAIQGLFK
jgi:hypothetical protein